MGRFIAFLSAGLLVISSIVYAVISQIESSTRIFVTWDSLEPDKWSSIWLIKNHIDPEASIEVRPIGDPLDGGIAFGVPDAGYRRSGTGSTFESLLVGFNQQDSTLKRFGQIITAIETTSWNTANNPLAYTVEQNFRRLQDAYDRIYVPIGCYGHFFDVLYKGLAQAADVKTLDQLLSKAVANVACEEPVNMAGRKQARRVKELSIDQLLSEVALDKEVVFVDTREPAEFARSHIPGAINIPMRDLNAAVYEQLKQADRVISYCVKDFRGYEVARQMLDNGVNNAAVMKPHGLSGWRSTGLPLASASLSEVAARERLAQCARDRQLCEAL